MARWDAQGRQAAGRCGAVIALCAGLLVAGLAGAGGAAANHYDSLLVGPGVCPKQRDVGATAREQKRAMRCLHRHARLNAERRAVNAQSQLQDAAYEKAADIMRCQQFSHKACGRSDIFYWPKYFGYTDTTPPNCWALGENISWASGANASARTVMSAWLHSDAHRTTILRPYFRDIGVGLRRGFFQGRSRAQVWVVILGRIFPPQRCAGA